MEHPEICIEGHKHLVVYARAQSGAYEAREFLDLLKRDAPHEHRQMRALIDRLANHGAPFHNDRKFKVLEDGIHELKSSSQRLCCYLHHETWVLTHGFKKGSNAVTRRAIGRAKEIRNAYNALFAKG